MGLLAVRKKLVAFRQRLSWKKALVGVGVLIVEEAILGILRKGGPLAWRWLTALGDLRIRETGALLLVVLILGIAWAAIDPLRAWQAWRDRKRKTAAPSGPSEVERRLVQDYRTVWNRYGRRAMDSLAYLFEHVKDTAKTTNALAELLTQKTDTLKANTSLITDAVADDSPTLIGGVRERFNQAYASYLEVGRWIATLVQSGDIDAVEENYTRVVSIWRDHHAVFFDKLEDLNEIPEHRGTLKIYIGPLADDSMKRFFSRPTVSEPSFEEERRLDLALRQLSDKERDFLRLLLPDSLRYDEPFIEGCPMLPAGTLEVGQSLAKTKVLVMRELRDEKTPVTLFSVPLHVVPSMKRLLFPSSDVRADIQIRWDRVWGSGGSGSGAPPYGGGS